MSHDLQQAATTALLTCMALKKNESLLVVTDDDKQEIGQALYKAGQNLSAEAVLLTMPAAQVNGQEPPQNVADMMAKFDVVICPTTKSLTHTQARRLACKAGARVGTMPGISKDIMRRTLKADYDIIAERTYRLSEILDKGNLARITTRAGTNLTLPIKGIKALASTGLIRKKGQGGNLPSGESYLMPEEGKTQGILVVDASVATLGLVGQTPIKITIRNGYAVAFEGGPPAQKLFNLLNEFVKDGLNVAELGIGTNHAAKISGHILEDEKVMGTIHIAFGNNVSMGGTCSVGIHIDCVVHRPTVFIDDIKILGNGRLLTINLLVLLFLISVILN